MYHYCSPMPLVSALLILLMTLRAQAESVPAGTRVEAKLQSMVKTDISQSGDEVVAVVTAPIRVRGSRLKGRVETIQAATHNTEGRVRLVFREIEFPDGQRASTWITNSFSASPPKRNRRYFIFVGIC